MSKDRAGRYFLEPRGKRRIYSICWYEHGQTRRLSTGTADRETARKTLYAHALKSDTPAVKNDQLARILALYWEHYGKDLASADQYRAAMRDALSVWGDCDVADLLREKQLELVKAIRDRGESDHTVLSRFTRLWAALSWAKRGGYITAFPDRIRAEDWKPYLPGSERTYSLDELAALFNAASDLRSEMETREREKSAAVRYAYDHWWRYLVLAVGTASRVTALLDLTWAQVDLRIGRINLNPPGRRQTKKRRPIVPIAPTLARELESWRRDGLHVITYYGRRLKTREFYDLLAERSGVDGGTHVIRHTVRTWLSEHGVPDSEADVFMGHAEEGSATGRKYKHRRPEYLAAVSDAVEALYDAVAPLIRRPFAAAEMEEQPLPGAVSMSAKIS